MPLREATPRRLLEQSVEGVRVVRVKEPLLWLSTPGAMLAPSTLPQHSSIHDPGSTRSDALPRYIAGGHGAMLPPSRIDATKVIRLTTLVGRLVVGQPAAATSGPRDMVRPRGEQGMARIAAEPNGFAASASCEGEGRAGRHQPKEEASCSTI